ncbi:MAG: fumarylacetoacetate hydrolase family protein, partial [Jatrophihabitans sp.]
MRLLSFDTPANPVVRIGIAVTVGGADYIIDAGEAYRLYLSQTMNEGLARRTAAALVPADMAHLLAGGDDSARALRALTTYAGSALDSAEGTAEWAASGRLHRWGDVRLAPPVPDPSKILAIGANYPDGAAWPTGPAPDPVVFAKLPSGLVPSGAEVALPPGCTDLDYEGELAVVIGRSCHLVAVGDALDAVAGYTIINDLTRRELLAGERTRGPIMFGKNSAGAAPYGPVLVTADKFGGPAAETLS